MRILPVLASGERVVVALSGGADSVALLLRLVEQGEWILTAAHLNHGIRGMSADRDQRFARELCARLKVALIEGRTDVPARAAASGEGLETAAREERRAFLLRVMNETSSTAIATAHHINDQAETVLMHLLRGGGVHGAAGMLPRIGPWAKPLLGVTRSDILDFLASRGQAYCEDETNLVCDTARNALRNRVLPVLQSIYPQSASTLARYAAIAAEEDDFMDREARKLLTPNYQKLPFGARLEIRAYPPALLSRMLSIATGADYESIQRLKALCGKKRGALSLTGLEAERAGEYLYLSDQGQAPMTFEVPLADGAALPGLGRMAVTPSPAEPCRDDPSTQVLDETRLKGAVLRTRRAGDRMRLLGTGHAKKLSDVFIDRKVDRPMRNYLPVVAKGSEVLWVPGLPPGAGAALCPDTKGALRLTWIREDSTNGKALFDR